MDGNFECEFLYVNLQKHVGGLEGGGRFLFKIGVFWAGERTSSFGRRDVRAEMWMVGF